jgi:pimeloyl-ACP methyl ester carboxylesterase
VRRLFVAVLAGPALLGSGAGTDVSAQSTEQWVVAGNDTVAVTIIGQGEPIVIIPGMIGGAFGFRRVAPELAAAGHRVIIVELLGTGASSRPGRADYTLEGHAARTAEVLDRAGATGALVVGHSIGASVALRLALVRPDLVSRIVSINGGPAEEAGTPGLRSAMRFAPIVKLMGSGVARRHLRSGLQNSSADPSWVTADVVAGYTAPYDDDFDGALRGLRGFANAQERQKLVPRLAQLRVPFVLLVGANRQPGAITRGEIEALSTNVPDFTLQTVASSGQYIHEERPDAVVRAVLGAVSNDNGRSP